MARTLAARDEVDIYKDADGLHIFQKDAADQADHIQIPLDTIEWFIEMLQAVAKEPFDAD